MTSPLEALQAAVGYRFRDEALLLEALTHRSFANESRSNGAADNERLEFLGDAVLGFLVSTLLCERFPEAQEGELTRRRADLVCEANLAAVARALNLGAVLRFGRGEESTGGRTKTRLLACALEAYLGAIYLDGGLEPTMDVARRIFSEKLMGATPGADDYKSRLQERLQAEGRPTPVYEVVAESGPDHERVFRIRVRISGQAVGEAEGRSKTEAEQGAARAALEALADAAGSSSAK